MDQENSCFYVGSRGLLKSCIHHSSTPRSSMRIVDYDINLNALKDGDTIYICSSAIQDFVKRVLPTINKKFVLVSGDSDSPIPCGVLSESDFNHFIADERLIVWFSQNLVFSPKVYPKLQHLPIGLDYHTMANNNMYWGPPTTPKMQEQLLLAVAKKARPLSERKPIAYTTFHFAIHRGSRQQAYNEIPRELVYYEPSQIKRLNSWTHQIEYAFVVSPPGEGIDCHRTWEALCLGCIPIMISSPLDDMFEGLPVLIVQRWSDVTKELLDDTIAKYSMKEFCLEKLELKYWVNKINAFARQ